MLRITNISAGPVHSMVLREDGTVKCFGKYRIPTPSEIEIPERKIISMVEGNEHFIVLLDDGTTRGFGRLAQNLNFLPKKIIQIAAAIDSYMVLFEDGTIDFFGNHELNTPNTFNKKIINIVGNNISYGALFEDGTVGLWSNTQFNEINFLPKKIKQFAIGDEHYVALLDDNTIIPWGENYNGQLPIDYTGPRVKNIYAGYDRTVLLLEDGTIRIFGGGVWATQIGPQQSFLPKKITNVAIGGTHVLILLDDGSVKSFGNNDYGQAPPTISFKKVTPVLDTNEYKSDLVTRMTCPICLDNEKKVRLNCGHMLCEICSDRVDKCSECREPITTRHTVFYNKYLKYKNKYLVLKKML